MHIDYTGDGLDITPALKEHTAERFKKLERHFDHIHSTHVILKLEKHLHVAEAIVSLPLGKKLHATASDRDMYHAITLLVGKLDHQLIEFKEKLTDHRD